MKLWQNYHSCQAAARDAVEAQRGRSQDENVRRERRIARFGLPKCLILNIERCLLMLQILLFQMFEPSAKNS